MVGINLLGWKKKSTPITIESAPTSEPPATEHEGEDEALQDEIIESVFASAEAKAESLGLGPGKIVKVTLDDDILASHVDSIALTDELARRASGRNFLVLPTASNNPLSVRMQLTQPPKLARKSANF